MLPLHREHFALDYMKQKIEMIYLNTLELQDKEKIFLKEIIQWKDFVKNVLPEIQIVIQNGNHQVEKNALCNDHDNNQIDVIGANYHFIYAHVICNSL